MKTTKYAPIGSISSGTVKPEDLVPEFLYVLGQLDKARHDELCAEFSQIVNGGDYDCEEVQWLMDALETALSDRSPPYSYFGSCEGDGADFGFWIDHGGIDDACRDGEVLAIIAGDEWPETLPEGTEYVVEVNDHGNTTLFTTDGEEIWSVV